MGRSRTTPVKKTRLAQMIARRLVELERSQDSVGQEFGFSTQVLSSWKAGSVPRVQMYGPLSRFLGISVDMVKELADEAAVSTGNTKLPDMGAPVLGKGSGDSVVMDKFASGYARPSVDGCFAIRIDGRHMWVNPRLAPTDGNTVLLKDGRLVKWPADGDGADDDVAGVVVLAEMV